MYIDNQASIRSTQSYRSTPGHYLTDHMNRQMKRVFKRHPNLRLQICWIPGHSEVEGNEAVDVEAKKAATEGSSPDEHLPVLFRSRKPLPISKSAAKQAYAARLKVRNKVMISKSPRYVSICRIDDSTPSNKYQKLVSKLARPQASILAQLRMGRAPQQTPPPSKMRRLTDMRGMRNGSGDGYALLSAVPRIRKAQGVAAHNFWH